MALAQYREKFWFPSGTLAADIPARVFPEDDNVLAPLFTDSTGTTPEPNPTRTDAQGFLDFWAEEGTYWLHIDTEALRITLGGSEEPATEGYVLARIADHNADTTDVHGIPDTSLLATQADLTGLATEAQVSAVADDLADHEAATTGVHGIADTAALATDTDVTAVSADLAAHEADTLNVHGIADTSVLVTQADLSGYATSGDLATVANDLADHEAATTNVHGIADTAALATDADVSAVAGDLAAHEAATTSVHGIADTSLLLTETTADAVYVRDDEVGAPDGVAALDSDGQVPVDQLRLVMINVVDHGAVGDGSTDDSSAFQVAFNQAQILGGGWVVVPPGDYMLATLPLRWYSNTRLTLLPGARLLRGAASTLLINGDAAQDFPGYTGHGNLLVEGGVWDMRGTVVTSYNLCLAFGHAQNITIRDLTILDTPGFHAIEINSSKTVRIDNCRFLGLVHTGDRGFTEAVQLDLAKGASYFGGFGPYDHTPCEDVTITRCTFGASGTAGSAAWPRGVGSHSATKTIWHRRVNVHDNTFENLTNLAVSPYNWEESQVTENRISGCGAGIRVNVIDSSDPNDTLDPDGNQTGTSQPIRDIVVSDNIVRDTGGASEAILVQGETTGKVRGLTVGGNVIDGVAGSENGIRLEHVENYSVSRNTLTAVQGTGISQDEHTGGVVSGNRIYDGNNSGISVVNASDVKVLGNVIEDVDVNGIHVLSATDIDVEDNTIKGASRATHQNAYGIRVSTSTTGLRAVGNRVRASDTGPNEVAYGLAITGSCSNTTRYGNDLWGSIGPLQDNSPMPRTTPWDDADPLVAVMRPDGWYETRSRLTAGDSETVPSGTLSLVPLWLPRGVELSVIGWFSGIDGSTSPTHQWFMILDNNRVGLAVTTDDTTTAWPARTAKELTIAETTAGAATSYRTTYTGLHYLGFMVEDTDGPSIEASGSVDGAQAAAPGFGYTTTGLTTPPTVTGGAFTAAAFDTSDRAPLLYGYVR